jgi:hypothetical protein
MSAREVKSTRMLGVIRETVFTDGTEIYEEIKPAKVVTGKRVNTVENSLGTVSYSMLVETEVNGSPKQFNALVYANLYDSDKLSEDTFGADAEINLAISKAKDKHGDTKIYARIELPALVTANDVFTDDDLSPELKEALGRVTEEASKEASKTSA